MIASSSSGAPLASARRGTTTTTATASATAAAHLQQRQVLLRPRRRHDRPPPRAAPDAQTTTTGPPSTLDLSERAQFLRRDLLELFTDVGVDRSAYADRVQFLDPITRYSTLSAYLFNIAFLRKAFDPQPLQVHGLRKTGPFEITSRWTMTMRFSPARLIAGGKYWDPRVEFSGTSAYGFDPETGKICRHVDTWDSVQNQDFFSPEAFSDFLGQLANVRRTPAGLGQPPCETLRRHATFIVRKYAPFLVAEAPLDGVEGFAAAATGGGGGGETDEPALRTAPTTTSFNPAGRSVGAFRALAAYLFGQNTSGVAMKMTTPVLSDSRGRMQFVLPLPSSSSSSSPQPIPGSSVSVREDPGGLFAVREFSGVATPAQVAVEASALRADVAAAGFRLNEGGAAGGAGGAPPVRLARYNDPSVKPRFRRNEVLLPLDEASFDLWKGGPGEGAPDL